MIRNLILIGTIALVLNGCASGPVLAPPGAFGMDQSVTLERNWSDISPTIYGGAKKVKLLTIDGILLNRLYISEALTSEDPLFIGLKGDTKSAPAPRGSNNMSLSEHIEYVTRSLAELDFQKIESSKPKQVTVSGQKGVRFELTLRTAEGLNIKGLAQAVSKGNKAYYIIYLAPEVHYYQASLKNAVAVMDSATLK